MATAIGTAKLWVWGRAQGFHSAQVSAVLSALRARLETCWWPTEDAAGGRYLRLAMILFKMLRSSKAEISASCGKEENTFFTVSCRCHLISNLRLPRVSWPSSNIPWMETQVVSSPHHPFPASTTKSSSTALCVSGPGCGVCLSPRAGKSSLGRRHSPALVISQRDPCTCTKYSARRTELGTCRDKS